MRREALARWLNLTTVLVVAIALVFAATAPGARPAKALNQCGEVDDPYNPVQEGNGLILEFLEGDPESGPPFTPTGVGADLNAGEPENFRLVWDADLETAFVITNEYEWNYITDLFEFRFNVPGDAAVGDHVIRLCYDDGDQTYYTQSTVTFTVTDWEMCGGGGWGDWAGQPAIDVDPAILAPGDPFTLTVFDAQPGDPPLVNASLLQVIWDFDFPAGEVIEQQSHVPGNDVEIMATVPADAPEGVHAVAICYFVHDGGAGDWWYTYAVFPEVIEEEPELPDLTSCSTTPTDLDLDLTYSDEETEHTGPAGRNDTAIIFNDFGLGDGITYYLIWDFGTADPFILTWENSLYYDDSLSLPFTVPWDAELGPHTIRACYLYFPGEGDPYWVSSGNEITFIVTGYSNCGGPGMGSGDGNVFVTLTPTSGIAGSTFSLTIDGTDQTGETNYFQDAYMVQVIWNYGAPGNVEDPPSGLFLVQVLKTDEDAETMTIPGLQVPTAAQPDIYPVNVCFYIALDLSTAAETNDGYWIAAEPDDFQVVAQAPTATSVPPTATQQPDDEEPEPEPTLTPTPTVPIVPIFGPPVSPTVIGNVARTAPEMTQTALAGLPQTPGPGTTNAGGGGGGGEGGGGPGGGGPGGGGGTTLNPNTGAQETTTPGTGTPTASSTPAPTATRGPATPTPTPAPTTSPSSDVQGSRTEFVQSVKSFTDISDDFDVVLTNVLLTGLVLLLIFLTSEIFNQTIRDNQDDVESWMRNFFGPVIGLWGGLSAMMGAATLGNQKLKDLAWLGIVLVITVLIEGFLDPDFGFNKSSVLLFLSLLVAVGFVTYLTEGGEAFVARSFFGQSTAVRVFPAAIGIALVCVIMSRLGGFIPGILYGFVGTAVFLRPSTMNADQDGKTIFFPMAMMLALSVGAWMLVDQFRGPDASDFDVFVEGVLIGVFIATIEGVAINMLPIAYMDGRKLIDWNPIMWILTAGVAVFLLWTVLLNDERAYFNSLQETTSQVALIAVVFCFGLSIITWAWFRYRPGGHA